MEDDRSTLGLFAHCGRYGVPGWPRRTILCYRLTGTERHTSWKRTYRIDQEHAEERMVKDRDLQPSSLKDKTYTLEMVSNFSPCKDCSDTLIEFKEKFKLSVKILRITMRVSSFYATYYSLNMDGLVNLVKENIVLKIFDGDPDWTEFLRDVINVPEEYFYEWLAVPLTKERRAREYIDRVILNDIYSCYRGDISLEDLYEIGRDPSNAHAIIQSRKERFNYDEGGARM